MRQLSVPPSAPPDPTGAHNPQPVPLWVRMSLVRALRRGATPAGARWAFVKREFDVPLPRRRACVRSLKKEACVREKGRLPICSSKVACMLL